MVGVIVGDADLDVAASHARLEGANAEALVVADAAVELHPVDRVLLVTRERVVAHLREVERVTGTPES